MSMRCSKSTAASAPKRSAGAPRPARSCSWPAPRFSTASDYAAAMRQLQSLAAQVHSGTTDETTKNECSDDSPTDQVHVTDIADSPRHDRVRPARSRAGHARYSAVRRWPAGSRSHGRPSCATSRSRPSTPARASRPSKRPRRIGATLDLKVKTLDKLQNLDHGLWQGMLVSDVKTKQPKVYRQWQEQPETVCPPQGETLSDGQAARAGGARQAAEEAQGRRRCWPSWCRSRWPASFATCCGTTTGATCGNAAKAAAKWELIEVPQTVAAK